MSIDDHIETVKVLLDRVSASPNAASWRPKLESLADFLSEQRRLMAPIPKSLGDLSDLPDELLRELSVKKTDELEDQILAVMRACEGEGNLDQVLVGLYRKFKVVQTRRFIQNKLYRMSRKELVFQIPGQRAAYSLEPQSGSGDPPRDDYDDGYGGYSGSSVSTPSGDADDDKLPF